MAAPQVRWVLGCRHCEQQLLGHWQAPNPAEDSCCFTLLQETKLRQDRLQQAANQAHRAGWKAAFGPALATCAKGTSGGTAVCVRKGVGVVPNPAATDGYEHRIAGAWVQGALRGGVHFFSVYLKDGEGVSDTNLAILTELAALLGAVRGPWVVGGDWNLTPEMLAQSGWTSIVKGRVAAPAEPTCNGKTYDYFVVSESLSDAVQGVVRIADGGCNPHWAARLYLSGATRHKAVRRLVRPDKVPADLPHGPLREQDVQPPPPGHFPSNSLADDFNGWYSRVRDTWHALLGTTAREPVHRFRWEAATGRLACPDVGASNATAAVRATVRRTDEVARLIAKGRPADDPTIRSHLKKNFKACSTVKDDAASFGVKALEHWCNNMEKAVPATRRRSWP